MQIMIISSYICLCCLHRTDNIKSALSSYTKLSFAELALDMQADHLAWRLPKLDLSVTTCVWIGDDDQTLFNLSVTLNGKNTNMKFSIFN